MGSKKVKRPADDRFPDSVVTTVCRRLKTDIMSLCYTPKGFDELACEVRGNLENLLQVSDSFATLKKQKQADDGISDKSTGK